MSIETLVRDKSILVIGGSGGVGKTTTAAAIATAAVMHDEIDVLVITVDPARRLADVLGIAGTQDAGTHNVSAHNEATEVVVNGARGRMFAQMLDTKTAWDQLVNRHSPDDETARKILANPLYGEITGRFVQSHDYIAMETLHEIDRSAKYDLVIVDTPPATQAVDFLDAPQRLASFFDSRLLKFLVAPAKATLMSFTTRAFLKLADSLLGKSFLEDITRLFTLLETMRPGFIARANEVSALLRHDKCSFIVVTTPEPAPARSAQRLIELLDERGLALGAVVMNKVLPRSMFSPTAAEAADEIAKRADELSKSYNEPVGAARVLRAVAANHVRFAASSNGEARVHETLTGGRAVRVSAPLLSVEVDDVDSQGFAGLLHRLGESIWR